MSVEFAGKKVLVTGGANGQFISKLFDTFNSIMFIIRQVVFNIWMSINYI